MSPARAFTARARLRAVLAGVAVLVTLPVAAPPALAADRIRDAEWHLDFLKVAQAHKISQGAGVTVAVIDTGVDASHPDLAGAVVAGRDFAILKADPPDGRTDLDGHGTAMAGLIAGRGHGNGDGVLGIAPKATILPVRKSEGGKDDKASDIHTAIRWAAEHGADVISMSFGGEESASEAAAIEAARRADVVLVAAAGNRPDDKAVGYPAKYPGVITVGGADRRGNHADISVTGPEVDIVAPAVDIMSIDKDGKYDADPGTSNATAIVAGAAALVRAKYPDLSAAEVAHRLTATATDKGPKGRDDQYGEGVLNLVAALTADVPPMPSDQAEPLPEHSEWQPAPPPAAAGDGDSGLSTGLVVAGVACILLAGLLLIGGISLMLVRSRRRTV